MAKRWKPAEITYMRRYAPKRQLSELAERFKTDSETVAAKLTKMGVTARDMVVTRSFADDPNVQLFERAVKATYQKKWREAAKMLERVRRQTDLSSLAEQASRFLMVCEERLTTKKPTADPFLEAVFLRNRGELDRALQVCLRRGRASKDERFAYLAAAIHAVQGDHAKAAEFLGKAIETDSRNRVVAARDEDFDSLRRDPDFSSLFVA